MQGIQGISPQATDEFGVTCCLAAKAAELTGKSQGILEFTVQLSHDETGIAFIQFPQKLFPQALERNEAVAVCRSHELGFRPSELSRSIDSTASVAVKMEDSGANGDRDWRRESRPLLRSR